MPSRTLLLALALCAAAAAAHAACEEPFADIDSALLDQAKALTDAVIKQYAVSGPREEGRQARGRTGTASGACNALQCSAAAARQGPPPAPSPCARSRRRRLT